MAGAGCRFPRLATPLDIPRLVSGENVSYEWPPPGTVVLPVAAPEKWIAVCGEPSTGDSDTWHVTTLGEVSDFFDLELEAFLLQLAARTPVAPVALWAGGLSHYPVIYTYAEGEIMQWIRTIVRGQLGGGVEQFQFKLDWGHEGDDPTLSETDAPAFAAAFKAFVASAWAATQTGGTTMALCCRGVKLTEVGVCQWTQSSPKNSDGSGGDAAQSYPTAWSAFTVGSEPLGTSSANALPFEVACAVSFRTDKRGPRGRGRVYLPPFAVDAMNSGLGVFTDSAIKTGGGFIQDIFDAVNGSSYAYDPLVVSMRGKELHKIQSIDVGNVPDSQRRRRRSQTEARATIAYTP